MSADIKRYWLAGPWLTRDLKECVLAHEYDELEARSIAQARSIATLVAHEDRLMKQTREQATRIKVLEELLAACSIHEKRMASHIKELEIAIRKEMRNER
jgi:hypothetical protein